MAEINLENLNLYLERLLKEKPYNWESIGKSLEDHEINPYTHLANRIEKESVDNIINATKQEITEKKPEDDMNESDANIIEFDDFAKLDLRVAEILQAEEIEGADKLLKFRISLGTEERVIIAGIKKHYKPEELVGKHIAVVANLKPRKMKFGTSEGMLLAASSDEGVFLLSPDKGAKAGDKIS